MSFQKPDDNAISGYLWFVLAILVFLAWGIQAFFMKKANDHIKTENIFFYMTVSGLMLIYAVIPNPIIITGIVIALIAVYLMAD